MDTETLSFPPAVRNFSSCLANAVPTALVPRALAEVLIRDANERLNLACAEGIRLEDIYIDDDCLPSWLGMCWDPEDEAPHGVVQRRLLETQHALDLGDLLQREIRIKSERKLREAQSLGLSIEHIVIGTSLLPEWDPARVLSEDLDSLSDSAMDFSDGAQVAQRPVDDLDEDEEEDDDDDKSRTLSLQEMQTYSPQESLIETHSNRLRILIADAMIDMQATQCSDVSDDDDDEDEAEAEDASQDIFMQNACVTTTGFGLDERSYLNVIRGVEIVGGPQHFADVDLEVLLAIDDDEEYAALPEVELAVDGEAFIRHFGQKEIVNVDIAGVELSCFDAMVEGNGQCSEDTVHETGHGDDDDDDDEDITENGDDADEGGIIELGQIGGDGAGVGNDDSESSCSEED